MRILLLAQHYAPEEVSGAVLATELAESLADLGHEVTFVTAAPSYPAGRVFDGYRNALLADERRSGVRVIRVWSYISPDRRLWKRLLNFGTFSIMALVGGLAAGKPDVVFSYSPPLPLGLAAWLLSRLRRVPWILRVEDLYPDTAVAAGVLRNRLAIAVFSHLERFLYRAADAISLISEGFRRNLLAKDVSPHKLSVTPVWADPDAVQPLEKHNSFREKHGLAGQFVVMHAGTLGHASALEEVLDAAEVLITSCEPGDRVVRFVIVGEGVKKQALMADAGRRGLSNVVFLPFEPRERFAEMMAAADAGLVTQDARSAKYSLPSKTFNIMSSARPILAITPTDSEIADLVVKNNCGVNVAPGQPHQVAGVIRSWIDDGGRLHQMANSGRAALVAQYSRRACVESFVRLLTLTVDDHNRTSPSAS